MLERANIRILGLSIEPLNVVPVGLSERPVGLSERPVGLSERPVSSMVECAREWTLADERTMNSVPGTWVI